MEEREDWRGALNGRNRALPTELLIAPLHRSESGAAAFLGLMDSGDQYWIKVVGNPQGDQILVTEQLVSAAGRLIGAPVRQTALVQIPEDIAGWRYGEFQTLRAGVAHGSLHLDSADVIDDLLYTASDDNARRQPALAALWDWCLGEDEQWLYDLNDDRSIWTFDHGLWLDGGFGWTGDQLELNVDSAWPWNESPVGMDQLAFLSVADRLEAVGQEDLLTAVCGVPLVWDVPQFELETVAWLLYRRRKPVAARLRAIAATL